MTAENYLPVPQPEEISTREREDAMGAYLMMFASLAVGLPLPIINLLAAIIYYFANRKKSRFVHFHVLQSLLSQLPTSLLNAGAVFWTFSILFSNSPDFASDDVQFSTLFSGTYVGYLIMVFIANLVYFIFSIIAATKAHKGRFYYMLFFGRASYNIAFNRNNTIHTQKEEAVNLPPR